MTTPQSISIKLKKISIKNFRGIGNNSLDIDLDNIVILVGPNNSGKSTVLKALDLITQKETNLSIDDFFEKDIKNLPEIEIHSHVLSKADVHIDEKKWINSDGIVKEKWIWSGPGKGERIGFRVDSGVWSKPGDSPQAPFATDSAASNHRPAPTYISPFDQPDKQVEKIKQMIASDIYEDIKNTIKLDAEYQSLQKQINELQKKMKKEGKRHEEIIENELGIILSTIFDASKVGLNVPESNPDFLASFASSKDIELKIDDLGLENQGSGMQRALLWSVLKLLAERQKPVSTKKKAVKKDIKEPVVEEEKERTRIMLMDEPEICLHPDSIRQARGILYDLTNDGRWQVIITSHSPIFIDLSKDNTNVIRVQRNTGEVNLYKSSEVSLSPDEKDQLKMLNIVDPYFAEFFFSKKVILVEGDTEYTVFNKIISENKKKYRDIQIIRARGKYTMLPIIKILSKWKKEFSILHDSDTPKNKNGGVNSAWIANGQIFNLVKSYTDVNIKLLSSRKNFESAFFGAEVTTEKPYNAFLKMIDPVINEKVTKLLDYLIGEISTLGISEVIEYNSLGDLEKFIE